MKTFAFLAALLLPAAAFAGNDGDQSIGVGGTYWSHLATIGTTATIIPTSTAGAAVNALFPAGDIGTAAGRHHKDIVPVIAVSAATTCCWTQHLTALDIDSGSISDVNGPNGSGPGACFRLETAGVYALERPNRKEMIQANVAGERSGLCSSSVANSGDGATDSHRQLYAPCDADADCSSYGAGTCTTSAWSTAQEGQAAVFLECEADAASTKHTVWKQRVSK